MSESSDQEAHLLAECPVCDYALHGLPVEHTCPECGLAFDRRWWVYGGVGVFREWSHSVRAYQIVAAVACVIVIYLFLIKPLPKSVILGISMVIPAAVGLAYWFSNYRPQRFVALGPTALVVYHSPSRIDRYPWPTITNPRADVRGKCVVFDSAGKTIRVKGYDFFRGVAFDVERCARGITQYTRDLERYPA